MKVPRVLFVVLMLLPSANYAQATKEMPPPAPEIEKLMSAAQFKEAGLNKLSAEELAALNRWLSQYSNVLISAVAQRITATQTSSTPDVIESYIDGDFEGWEGETIFKLDNGQIWQQASYSYKYHYAYHPKVVIYRSGNTYKMQVEGVRGTIPVKRLK